MANKPKAKPKRRKMTAKEQSERFIEAARNADADESGETFEKAFGKIVPPKRVVTKSTES